MADSDSDEGTGERSASARSIPTDNNCSYLKLEKTASSQNAAVGSKNDHDMFATTGSDVDVGSDSEHHLLNDDTNDVGTAQSLGTVKITVRPHNDHSIVHIDYRNSPVNNSLTPSQTGSDSGTSVDRQHSEHSNTSLTQRQSAYSNTSANQLPGTPNNSLATPPSSSNVSHSASNNFIVFSNGQDDSPSSTSINQRNVVRAIENNFVSVIVKVPGAYSKDAFKVVDTPDSLKQNLNQKYATQSESIKSLHVDAENKSEPPLGSSKSYPQSERTKKAAGNTAKNESNESVRPGSHTTDETNKREASATSTVTAPAGRSSDAKSGMSSKTL